ncbi:hypothetical protein ACFSTH_19060 [Paenibacillus yanchengensis]|uniref:Uncharacterized protein n=1 Tax=Paenibacillus yanchengensis TaxID=2035833 RepID=A0ABW4YLW7_9BACL
MKTKVFAVLSAIALFVVIGTAVYAYDASSQVINKFFPANSEASYYTNHHQNMPQRQHMHRQSNMPYNDLEGHYNMHNKVHSSTKYTNRFCH